MRTATKRTHDTEDPPGNDGGGLKHLVLKTAAQVIAYVVSRAIWDWLS